ncbi:mRNA 3'-end-processing protein YTH1 [Hondaea fermentalgiana]|uniref:mRNA 3'-end-processing protein YTH1 n=1 Tax=Hondaea fermentalgiana TaxID=2315210 RepID=A0A2R5GH36_9STRA|nr:mRNA 3'-end-processing protein YTH1 [Hondaea fermentalgiana]|eukprot:GBG29058.1 mRNA 3'-end-processing protein YTH1 [Hondaea fermentalgiana]
MLVLKPDFQRDGADHRMLFDFELDTARSVQNKGGKSEQVVKSREQRYKTVVCRHWVKDLCMKMEDCEYLHELNPSRMPECRWGEKCQVPDCIFKHTKEEDRVECLFYKIGFCRKGQTCHFRHVRHAPEELPEVVPWDEIGDNKMTVMEITSTEDGIEKKTIVQHNENYKVSICKHWKQTGDCPFGQRCHFAHGVQELRQRGGEGEGAERVTPPKTPLDDIVENFQTAGRQAGALINPLDDLGDDLNTPDKEIFQANGELGTPAYVIVRTTSMDHVAASLKYSAWSVLPCFMNQLNRLYDTAPQVYIIFAANDCSQFTGCAIMRSRVEVDLNVPIVDLPPEANNHAFMFKVEWVYTCSLDFTATAFLRVPEPDVKADLPVAMAYECTELPVPEGHALLVMMYRQPHFAVDVSQIGDVKLSVHMEGPDPSLYDAIDEHIEQWTNFEKENPNFRRAVSTRGPNGPGPGGYGGGSGPGGRDTRDAGASSAGSDQVLGPGGVPVAPGSIHIRRPGFVIGCDRERFCHEMVRSGVLAGTYAQKSAMAVIQPGTPLVLLDVQAGKLVGVFEALGAAEEMIEPMLFVGPNDDGESSLPLQVRTRRVMEAPPLNMRQVPATVLVTDGGMASAFTPVEPKQMQQLANLFARAAGAPPTPVPDAAEAAANFPPGISVHDIPDSRNNEIGRSVAVNVPFSQDFKAAHRIIGKGGSNIQRIQNCGVRCIVKALGAPSNQNQGNIVGPFEVLVYSENAENVEQAIHLVYEMANQIIDRFEERMRGRGGGRGPPGRGPPGRGRDGGRDNHRDNMSNNNNNNNHNNRGGPRDFNDRRGQHSPTPSMRDDRSRHPSVAASDRSSDAGRHGGRNGGGGRPRYRDDRGAPRRPIRSRSPMRRDGRNY